MKHTPGKWFILESGRSYSNESNGRDMVGCIAHGDKVICYLPNHMKDANLIAAAPELLDALKMVQAAIREHHLLDVKKRFSLCLADAAIGKAIAKAENTHGYHLSEGR